MTSPGPDVNVTSDVLRDPQQPHVESHVVSNNSPDHTKSSHITDDLLITNATVPTGPDDHKEDDEESSFFCSDEEPEPRAPRRKRRQGPGFPPYIVKHRRAYWGCPHWQISEEECQEHEREEQNEDEDEDEEEEEEKMRKKADEEWARFMGDRAQRQRSRAAQK
ncbi:hypothetical protein CONPUDRAFT_155297 [Coniophora puteana RWD-64-598 SS2]|uniref:Uncharacterized protein n=1 Tax=Coniophora puteana (strain RWD-64-598) TaxID=741705 RepID=A0A5M3MMR6_CONPW|nr:uncharacterized protein CONPUDRAFT_155297 [Coniophora puteana RWD-64-598 SS2]EIW79901.1 hypothetical protein CONPUDRAFT_155297 [Coniophora puteana RWD-64-598 SS2]